MLQPQLSKLPLYASLLKCEHYALLARPFDPQVGAKLVVLNLSQQTDSSDLLGGFRPVQPAEAVLPLLDRFADLVRAGQGATHEAPGLVWV